MVVILVALDPSIRSCGLAMFEDGTLIHAESVKMIAGSDVAARALAMARQVSYHVETHESGAWLANRRNAHVVTEWPQTYRAQHAKGDPNDLHAIAAVGTAVAALLGAAELVSYTPREWAGQVPKTTKGDCRQSPRARQIRSRLLAAEIPVWEALRSSDHDAIDAIGIGCHHLSRPRLARP